MCGISGIYNTKNDSVIDINIVRKMLQKIAHRGPDGEDAIANIVKRIGMAYVFPAVLFAVKRYCKRQDICRTATCALWSVDLPSAFASVAGILF